jgi:hypothetical protein
MLPTSPAKHLAFFLKLKNPKTSVDDPMIIKGDVLGSISSRSAGAVIYRIIGIIMDKPYIPVIPLMPSMKLNAFKTPITEINNSTSAQTGI